MRKIIFMVVAIMLTFGLFAQDKNVIDGEAAKEIDKLKTALEEAGIDFNDCNFIPETIGDVEDDMSVDEFIESLDSGIKDSRSTYISSFTLTPIYQIVWNGSGYVFVWTEDVRVSVAVSGSECDGVKYTRESTGGTIVQTVYNGLSYTFCDLVPSYPVLCAQLYNNSMVYIPGYGWISVKVTFGDKECGTVNFNW